MEPHSVDLLRESRASDHFKRSCALHFSQGKLEIGHEFWAHAILETGFPHKWNKYVMMLEMSQFSQGLGVYVPVYMSL